jgi:MFS family permease
VFIRSLPALGAGAGVRPLAAVAEGLRFTLSRPSFRWLIALVAAVNLLLVGPLLVGIPVLAQTRFSQGAAAFGFLISAYGIGCLGGMIVAGSMPRPTSHTFTSVLLALFVGFGLVIGALAFITSVWVGVAALAVLGVGDGYVAVVMITLVQRSTPTAMLGRVMSLVMLAMLGVTPVSQAASGALVKLGPEVLFVGCGAGMLAVAAVAAVCRRSWSLDAFEAGSTLVAESA